MLRLHEILLHQVQQTKFPKFGLLMNENDGVWYCRSCHRSDLIDFRKEQFELVNMRLTELLQPLNNSINEIDSKTSTKKEKPLYIDKYNIETLEVESTCFLYQS